MKKKSHTGVGEYKSEDGHLLLELNEDLCSGVAHQTLLDLSQQKLLHWNFPALHKELLVEFSYNLWNLILSHKNKQMISGTKPMYESIRAAAAGTLLAVFNDSTSSQKPIRALLSTRSM